MSDSCASCYFMRQVAGNPTCRRSAPNAVGMESTSFASWKPVRLTDWCGDGADAITRRWYSPDATAHHLVSIGSAWIAIGASTVTVMDAAATPAALIIIMPTADPGSDIWLSVKSLGSFQVSTAQKLVKAAATFDYGIWI